MKNKLNNHEFELAANLINGAIYMAKQSLELALQSPIKVQEIDFSNEPSVDLQTTSEYVHLVKTDLKGQLTGTSFLIFSEEEVTNIYKACLPAEIIYQDTPESQIMKSAVLAEIDNMVAAAVITELANFLRLEMYGHVPELEFMQTSQVDDYINKELSETDSIMKFKAIFSGAEIQISPSFVWIFQNEFMEKVKEATLVK